MTKQSRIIQNSNVPQITIFEASFDSEPERLDNLILHVVDETLQSVFKEAGVKVIYRYMEKKCRLKREEIPKKPAIFSTSLSRMLDSAAPVIENLILKNLHRELHLKFEEKEGYVFPDYIKELRR
jgi:hypothetical protein